ncbi:MAG: OadG family protein [Planctomycetaceae bacterium]|nr:OadG family protein [Planctomycetaceae bacterium]
MDAAQSFGFGSALGISVLGFCIVFFVLVVLMVVIRVLRALMESVDTRKAAGAAASASTAAASVPVGPSMSINPNMVPATGSLGEIKLHKVDDTTAAMLMAIVADELKAPLNELRFISIREKN